MDWTGLDWTGMEWTGLDWKLSCVCDARDYSHTVYGDNDTTFVLPYYVFVVKNRN